VDAAVGDDERIGGDEGVGHDLLVAEDELEDYVADFCGEGEQM
jgi:hypothetical protein